MGLACTKCNDQSPSCGPKFPWSQYPSEIYLTEPILEVYKESKTVAQAIFEAAKP